MSIIVFEKLPDPNRELINRIKKQNKIIAEQDETMARLAEELFALNEENKRLKAQINSQIQAQDKVKADADTKTGDDGLNDVLAMLFGDRIR